MKYVDAAMLGGQCEAKKKPAATMKKDGYEATEMFPDDTWMLTDHERRLMQESRIENTR